jgi:hypothetical protein
MAEGWTVRWWGHVESQASSWQEHSAESKTRTDGLDGLGRIAVAESLIDIVSEMFHGNEMPELSGAVE